MGGKGKGGAKAAFLPPARSRAPNPGEGGPTITEKIAARKAAGGAEAWDEFKARVAKQQQEQHALDNHDLMMSAQHREVLDREREARLRREPLPGASRQQELQQRKRGRSDSSSSDDDDSDSEPRKRHRKERKEKSHKHKHKRDKEAKSDKKRKKHHRKDHKKHKRKGGSSDGGGSSADDDAKPTRSEPVALSEFWRQDDSD